MTDTVMQCIDRRNPQNTNMFIITRRTNILNYSILTRVQSEHRRIRFLYLNQSSAVKERFLRKNLVNFSPYLLSVTFMKQSYNMSWSVRTYIYIYIYIYSRLQLEPYDDVVRPPCLYSLQRRGIAGIGIQIRKLKRLIIAVYNWSPYTNSTASS